MTTTAVAVEIGIYRLGVRTWERVATAVLEDGKLRSLGSKTDRKLVGLFGRTTVDALARHATDLTAMGERQGHPPISWTSEPLMWRVDECTTAS